MLNWLTKAAENAQRKNIERTLSLLLPAAAEADKRIIQTGSPTPSDQSRVKSLQKALITDLIGPVPMSQLREDYLQPVVADGALTDGAKMAVRHVFDTAERR